MRRVGRFFQIVGLIVAPLAMLLQFSGALAKGWQELAMLGGAVCLFCIGRVVESHSRA
jgi:hypothetical protein